ncbi:MAG: SMP-30/gluconolactonase/LRE family protein [Gammaproteobacteria bacterium]|nr:SMP-30/gluconolactonase/LRE family protein [Gammaproteobacteria bacterium]
MNTRSTSGAAWRLALDCRCALGESPVWLPETAELLFVDVPAGRWFRYSTSSGALLAREVGEAIGCIAPAVGGGCVAGLRSGIWTIDPDGVKRERLAANPEDTAVSRFNDGRVDPAGRLLIGTIDEPKIRGEAGLYRFDRRGLQRITGGLMTSNGLAFSPDGRTLYHADTPRFVVYRYDYDPASGAAENRRVFFRIEPTASDRGRPDGAAVDVDGCYWSALYEGGRLHRYDPDGSLMSVHPLPVRSPTMPAFGGPDLRTLYVTSAVATDGSGGGLYALDAGISGLPSPRFDPRI